MSMEKYEEVHKALLGKQFAQTGGRMGSLKTYDHAAGKICMEVDEATGVIRAFKKVGSTRVYDDIPEAAEAIVAELYEIAGGAPEPEPELVDAEIMDVAELQEEAENLEFMPDQSVGAYPKQTAVKIEAPKKPVFAGPMIKNFVPSLAEIGAIRIGKKGKVTKSQKTGNEFRPPIKFGHFIFTTPHKDEGGDFIIDAEATAIYGDKPKEIDVILLSNDPTINFRTMYNRYRGGKSHCTGDGETAVTLKGETIKCDINTCPHFAEKDCKLNGILSVILPKVGRVGGAYVFRTTGFYSVNHTLSSLFTLTAITGGVLAGIPLTMTLTPKQVQPKGTSTAKTIYVVNLEYRGGNADQLQQMVIETAEKRQAVHAQIAEVERMSSAALLSPPEETSEQIKDIELEFYPDGVEK